MYYFFFLRTYLLDSVSVEADSVTSDMVPILAGMTIPDPVFLCSIEPSSISVQKQLDAALNNLQKEDPSLRVGLLCFYVHMISNIQFMYILNIFLISQLNKFKAFSVFKYMYSFSVKKKV